jgi:lactate racemase
MRVAVDFQDEQSEFEVPDDRLVADWHGPTGVDRADVTRLVVEAVERPHEYPPLRQVVVPGDRVVVALDPQVPAVGVVLAAVCGVLAEAGVEANAITVLVPEGASRCLDGVLPAGVTSAVHDPSERNHLAYLAATSEGRRVYLNRLLTDADVVVPVARLGYDAVLGYRGPWGLLYPVLGDQEAAQSFRARAGSDWPDREHPGPALVESAEVSWLLGSRFQLGIVAGTASPAAAVAGIDTAVLAEGAHAVDRLWSFEAESRAELVVVGVGRPGVPAGIDDLARGLAGAARLVERGGKIVALSRVGGPIGPALKHVLDQDDPRLGPAALRDQDGAPDLAAARQIAQAMAWADVYLLSGLEPETVDDSSLVVLDRPEEARRLVATARSCLFFSHADLARARVADEAD